VNPAVPSAKPSLRSDTRGAVLVMGIVMGALLVGALWHIASVGDAIIWRERIQDAADASAFENAVWHARGMNVLAAINIVMSMVLAVLVVWRIALFMVTVALLVSGIFCVLSLGAECPVTATLLQIQQQMLRNDNRVATTVVRVLGAARAIETVVASVTPLLAFEQATAHTRGDYDVDGVRTLSASMIPSINADGARNFAACLATGKPKPKDAPAKAGEEAESAPDEGGALEDVGGFVKDNLSHPRMGVGVSLPVEEGSYDTLCSKAGEFFLNQYAGLFERIGAPTPLVNALDKVKGIMGKFIGKFPTEFCTPVGDGIPAELAKVLSKQAKDACDKSVDERAKTEKRTWVTSPDGEKEPGYTDPEDGKIKPVDELKKSCTEARAKKAKKELGDAIKATAKSMTECAKPAAVWAYAMNGNVFLRSFARIEHATPLAGRDLRGIQIADLTPNNAPATPAAEPVLAHAEAYFDCEGAWDECKDNAMWQLRWRARLRRVQPLRALAATAVEPALAAWLEGVIGAIESPLKSIKDTDAYDQAKGDALAGFYRSGAFTHAGAWLLGNPSRNPVIH
jgi:hypothetical protein